jgi:hypothetical protein
MGQSGRERERRSKERGRAAATSVEERKRAAGEKGESGCDVSSERRAERECQAGESGGRKKMMKTYGFWTWRAAQPKNEKEKRKRRKWCDGVRCGKTQN